MPPATNSDRIRHWPAMCRFYGLTLSELLSTPRAVLRVFEEELPVLQAQEQLALNMAADWPHLKESARKRLHKALIDEAGWDAPAPINPRADVRTLAGIGIKVVMEPPKEKPEEVSEAA